MRLVSNKRDLRHRLPRLVNVYAWPAGLPWLSVSSNDSNGPKWGWDGYREWCQKLGI